MKTGNWLYSRVTSGNEWRRKDMNTGLSNNLSFELIEKDINHEETEQNEEFRLEQELTS